MKVSDRLSLDSTTLPATLVGPCSRRSVPLTTALEDTGEAKRTTTCTLVGTNTLWSAGCTCTTWGRGGTLLILKVTAALVLPTESAAVRDSRSPTEPPTFTLKDPSFAAVVVTTALVTVLMIRTSAPGSVVPLWPITFDRPFDGGKAAIKAAFTAGAVRSTTITKSLSAVSVPKPTAVTAIVWFPSVAADKSKVAWYGGVGTTIVCAPSLKSTC